MSSEIHCPHCQVKLSETQLKTLWAEYCGSKKSASKTAAAKKNGAKGGRPMTYFQSLYDAIPHSIELLNEKLKKENAKYRFDIRRIDTPEPTRFGFTITCEDVRWHCSWDGLSDFISISKNGKQLPGISRINYAANRAALKLVQDIHREKLMSMPEDFSDIHNWIEQMTGKPYKPLSS